MDFLRKSEIGNLEYKFVMEVIVMNNGDEPDVDVKPLDLVYVALVIVAFLLGIIVTYSYYQNTSEDLYKTQKQLRKSEIYSLLSDSIIELKDEDYESAKFSANKFFKELKSEKEKGKKGVFKDTDVKRINFVLDKRDLVIEKLENKDETSPYSLKEIFKYYVSHIGK